MAGRYAGLGNVHRNKVTSRPAPGPYGGAGVGHWKHAETRVVVAMGANHMTEDVPLLELRGVSKSFGAVQALDKVNLSVPADKITALVGDNGAGKSVTIKTISGLWQPTAGEILWEGKPAHIHSPNDAEALGITTIYQDLALCDNLDIVQNLFLGHEKLRNALLTEKAVEIEAREVLSALHVTTVRSIRQPVASLSGGP